MTRTLFDPPWKPKDALISPDGLYRYTLERRWGEGAPVNFICLNPSTADAMADDPTVRRLVGFARSWGYGGFTLTNLFSWRATNPRELASVSDPIGPDNDRHLAERATAAGLVVCAWGAGGGLKGRGAAVRRLLEGLGVRPHRLALTSGGQPGHPLYLKADLRPIPFAPGPRP